MCEDDLFTGVLKFHFLLLLAGSGAAAGDKAQSWAATGVTQLNKNHLAVF